MKLYYTLNILILTLLFGMFCYGQDVYFVNGKVIIDDDKEKENDVTILLTDSSTTLNLPVTSTNSFTAKLKWNNRYYFKFMKSGYVTKIIEFSTFIPNGHTLRIEPYSINVKLFPVFKGVDKVFFKKPVAKVYFDKTINDFTDDREYALKVVYAIERMKRRADSKLSAQKNSASIKIASRESSKVIDKKNREISSTFDDNSLNILEAEVKQKSNDRCLLPPLKSVYPEDRTVEEYDFDDKHITRIIIREHNKYCAFLRVKHNWGGVYYFIDESPLGVFSVTESLFERKTTIFGSKRADE